MGFENKVGFSVFGKSQGEDPNVSSREWGGFWQFQLLQRMPNDVQHIVLAYRRLVLVQWWLEGPNHLACQGVSAAWGSLQASRHAGGGRRAAGSVPYRRPLKAVMSRERQGQILEISDADGFAGQAYLRYGSREVVVSVLDDQRHVER